MKRLLAVLILTFVVLSLFSCGDKKSENVTVDDIVNSFDEKVYLPQVYNDEQIASIYGKLSLSGEILSVIHIVNKSTTPPNLEWTYIYEFSSQEDAVWFEENRKEYVSTQENGQCLRFDKIVVFGNSPVIADLSSEK